MPVTINGSTGLAGVTGSASAPAVQGTSANSGIYFGGNTINMATSGSQALIIGSSGNVGIGNASPIAKLHVEGSQIFCGRENSVAEGGQIGFGRASDGAQHYSIDCYGSSTTPSLRFLDDIAATVRMSIDNSGNIMINGSSAYARLTIIQDPTAGPHISTSTAYSITNGSYLTLSSVTGMVLVSNDNNGDTGFYLVGGRAAVYLNSTKGTWVTSTTSPASGKTSVAYDSGSDKYRIYNNFGSTQNFFITYISNRNVI